MSEKIGSISMAQEVREYLRTNPEASNRQVILDLSRQGIVVNDYLPSFIRHEMAREERKAAGDVKKKPRNKLGLPQAKVPTVYVVAPFEADAVTEMLRSDNPNKVVRNARILMAKLDRTAQMITTMTEDDWKIEMLPETDGVLYSATHSIVKNVSQARSRMQKLGIMPNEIEIVPEQGA